MASRFSVEAIFKAIDKFTGPLGAMEKKSSKFVDGVSKGLGKLNGFNSSLDAGFRKAAAGAAVLGAAGGAAMLHVGKAGIDFEQQMADLGSAYLKTRKEIAPLEAEALRLGAATKFSAVEVGAAMENMAKAGFEQQDVLGGVSGMIYAAAAAGEDLAETTTNVSSVMKGMGIDIKQSTMVADTLALAANKTNASIGSLAESMSKVSSTARQLGVPLNDTVAMVSLLQDVGLDASEAGSAVSTMLTMMSKPSKKAAGMMKELGVSFQDAAGNMKSPTLVLGELVKAGKKAGGNMKQVAFFAELVGMRGQKAAVNLKELFTPDKDGKNKYLDLVDALVMAEGTAKRVADLKMDTFGGDLDVMGESVKGLEVKLYSLNNGPLRDVAKRVNAWIDANGELMVQKIQSYIVWTIDHLPQIVTWLERIGKAALAFYAFSTAVKVAQVAIQAYEASVAIAKAVTWGFKAAVWATGKTLGGTTKALGFAGEAMGLFNAEAAAGKLGMAGLRDGLNASMLGKQINGVKSLLGKAGLLGAAMYVGWEFGSWLNQTFELDKKIGDLIDKMRGIDPAMNGLGGVAAGPGLDPKGDQHLGDGTIKRADGTIKAYGYKVASKWAGPQFGAPSPVLETDAIEAARAALRNKLGKPQFSPQVVGPEERAAASQHTETEKTELVIKDETGRAELTKKPTGKRTRIRLEPTGGF